MLEQFLADNRPASSQVASIWSFAGTNVMKSKLVWHSFTCRVFWLLGFPYFLFSFYLTESGNSSLWSIPDPHTQLGGLAMDLHYWGSHYHRCCIGVMVLLSWFPSKSKIPQRRRTNPSHRSFEQRSRRWRTRSNHRCQNCWISPRLETLGLCIACIFPSIFQL